MSKSSNTACQARFGIELDALARLTKGITQSRGHVDQALAEAFVFAGWTKGNLIDAIAIIGNKTVSNYLHSTTQIPVDFDVAPSWIDLTKQVEPQCKARCQYFRPVVPMKPDDASAGKQHEIETETQYVSRGDRATFQL